MLMINDLTETKELARDEMSAIAGGQHTGGPAPLYPAFPTFTFDYQDNDMVSASIDQQMLNDIDTAFAYVGNTPTQNASINVFA